MSILDSSCLKFVFLRFLPDQTLLSSNVSFHRSNLGGEFPHLVIYQAKPTIRHLPSHHRLFALRQERCPQVRHPEQAFLHHLARRHPHFYEESTEYLPVKSHYLAPSPQM